MTTLLLDTPELKSPRLVRPIRVAHVSLTLRTGGLERILADLARHHDAREFTPEFIALTDVGRFADEIRQTGCVVHQIQTPGRWGQVQELARLFRAAQYDVVHAHNTYPHIYASLAARLARVPVVVSTRHGQRSGHGWRSRLPYRWAALLVDRVVAVSDDAAQLCVQSDGLRPNKVCRIWNGIDLSTFDYQGPASEPVAISVARLSAEKDFPTLLKAVALVTARVPDFRLQIVGDGPERTKLEGLTRELGICSRVEFLGERLDVAECLSHAAFFVTSSLTEGISLTLLEAMAVGLPVIATSVGGNPEIVVDQETGRLVPPADPQTLADAIVAICQRPQSWPEMGLAGRQRVVEHFDVRRMAADYEQLYRNLLQRHGRRVTVPQPG